MFEEIRGIVFNVLDFSEYFPKLNWVSLRIAIIRIVYMWTEENHLVSLNSVPFLCHAAPFILWSINYHKEPNLVNSVALQVTATMEITWEIRPHQRMFWFRWLFPNAGFEEKLWNNGN